MAPHSLMKFIAMSTFNSIDNSKFIFLKIVVFVLGIALFEEEKLSLFNSMLYQNFHFEIFLLVDGKVIKSGEWYLLKFYYNKYNRIFILAVALLKRLFQSHYCSIISSNWKIIKWRKGGVFKSICAKCVINLYIKISCVWVLITLVWVYFDHSCLYIYKNQTNKENQVNIHNILFILFLLFHIYIAQRYSRTWKI